MSGHKEALLTIRKTGLSTDTKYELYEQYLEDLDEHSVATALEKLGTGISDCKAAKEKRDAKPDA
jgi:hypothetical protein